MTDIGQTLREARMRAKIDITDVETATKIRAKYLRALENEEWNLLPGPTFVKSFLRTYAQYLGLDARMLVEEYKRRYERPNEGEAAPFGAPLGRDRERTRPGVPKPPLVSPRLLAIGGVVVVILLALFLIGKWGSGGGGGGNKNAGAPTTTTAKPKPKPKATPPVAPKPTLASLRLIPTGNVYVCLIDDKGNKRINAQTLTPTTPQRTFHAKRFLITVGNSQLQMRVNGKTLPVPASNGATNYVITPNGRHTRPPGQGPNCG